MGRKTDAYRYTLLNKYIYMGYVVGLEAKRLSGYWNQSGK